ncbi:MAG: sulfotransferase [Chloroflexi bacterium]|nr:sulfotransferase [Chloroflexota bacterium]
MSPLFRRAQPVKPDRPPLHREIPPPQCPPGWHTGPPDFIGVGTQKSGTSWWWALLAAHPRVEGSAHAKELHFLSRFQRRPMGDDDAVEYHRHFPRPPGLLAGEWTPRYMAIPSVAEAIERAAPEARLLAILRDPVERYRSGLSQWYVTRRRTGRSPEDERGESEAIERGLYARQLERLIERFGRDRVLVLQFERCLSDPAGQFGRTMSFLGLPEWLPEPEVMKLPVNTTTVDKTDLDPERRRRLVGRYERDVARLHELVPDLDLTLWPDFRHLSA